MRIPRFLRFLLPFALLVSAMPARAATETFVLDPKIELSLNAAQDTPLICAMDLIHNTERVKAGQDHSTAVIDAYADKAKLTPEAKGLLGRDCLMFDLGVLFNITINKPVVASPDDDGRIQWPGYNDTKEKR